MIQQNPVLGPYESIEECAEKLFTLLIGKYKNTFLAS